MGAKKINKFSSYHVVADDVSGHGQRGDDERVGADTNDDCGTVDLWGVEREEPDPDDTAG